MEVRLRSNWLCHELENKYTDFRSTESALGVEYAKGLEELSDEVAKGNGPG